MLSLINKIGVSPEDSEELVLQKNFMTYLGMAMSFGGLIWGGICITLGLYLQGIVPAGYVLLTLINFLVFCKTKNFNAARFVQLFISLVLPFVFQFTMGGFYASGGVMLWAIISLIAALTFVSIHHALYWLGAYVLFTVLSGMLNEHARQPFIATTALSNLFFVINLSVISSVVFGLVYYFVSSRSAALRRMEIAKWQAEQASRVKSEFLANMSHEIRTPLNGIIGFSELLINTKLTDTQQQYAATVAQSSLSLLDIINDILDFSKIEAGKLELSIDKSDLYDLCGQVADMTKYQAHKKGLEFLLNISPQVPRFIWADEMRLRQVMVNLLSNAIKFSFSGEIELKIVLLGTNEAGHHALRFSVRDTGIGIEKGSQQKIFEAFSQADSSTTKRFGGTGLGLTISNKLLELMNSQLHLQSEKEYGSTFYFDVVFKAEHGHAQEWGELQGYKNILIVDDNDSNRIILKDMLALRGIQSDEASGSRQALQKLQQGLLYDAIIIDYCMPDMTGVETIQQIRKNGMASSQCPIVLLYSSADDAYINAACEQLDVQQRMVKPIKLNQLYHTLSLLKSQNNNISLAAAHTIPALTTLPGEPLPKPEIKILIAEDHKINMALCKIFIRQIMPGAQIIEAENGQEAVEKFISEKPAMILMDIQMPQMDGYDACAAIRQYEVTPRVPIIALTAGTVKGEREKCLAAGMNDFVSKPFAKDTLSQVMSQWISLN